MAPNDDPEDAAARLEQALERIAQLAHRRQEQAAGHESADTTAEIAARLDTLIAQLRSALGTTDT
ncbi:hypothetical protein [Limobrevibacterium gyesilva]|uniref:Uncharacterized protein n=1 Tax=Limobrevibacterium gyesilva TaxID=2991712 RepID=A0AA42CG81_9PROT|nr:hypothetical protein [Limobrevibacterium gyesilva]MCW3477424.1 hypothetical protein [Limobrevibacterium gyesilva]